MKIFVLFDYTWKDIRHKYRSTYKRIPTNILLAMDVCHFFVINIKYKAKDIQVGRYYKSNSHGIPQRIKTNFMRNKKLYLFHWIF